VVTFILKWGARLPAAMLGFATVAVVVKDEKKAVKWYTEKLGFRHVDKFAHWHTVSPRGSSVRIHLCPDSKPEKGNTGFMFITKDIEKEVAALKKKGVKITVPVTKESYGTMAMFADPDGNAFWLFQD
jgi:catechol 2,3-dioxygenase-like lactoylglutathione lyase family enzyme